MYELLRPWKLFTLSIGISVLIYGSFYYQSPDWDITFSVIQALEAYLTAAWSMRVILDRRWKFLPVALFAIWFTVDGSYCIYWSFKDPEALEFMRWANFFASLSLYGICGILWLWEGSLKEALQGANRVMSAPRRGRESRYYARRRAGG